MILVTGPEGYIGNAIVSALKHAGKTICTVGRSNRCTIRLDLAHESLLSSPFLHVPPDAVIHCAAAVPTGAAVPDNTMNADMTRAIDRAVFHAVSTWCIPVVYLSGCSLYNRTSDTFLDETATFADDFESPYLNAKKDGDMLFSTYQRAIVARISAPIGPGISCYSVVGRFIQSARSKRKIEVWNSGNREQDFIDIRDIGRFTTISLQREIFGPVNIAAGKPVTMLNLAKAISSFFPGCEVTTVEIPDQNVDQKSRYSNKRAKSMYSWRPKTPFSQSLQDTISVCLP